MSVEPRGASTGSAYAKPVKQLPNDAPAVRGQPQLPAWVKTPAQANAYMKRGQNRTDAYLRQHREGSTLGLLGSHIANLALGILGTDTEHVSYAAKHPVARLQNKGPFKPTAFTTDAQGRKVAIHGSAGFPWPGAAGVLKEANAAAKAAETYRPRTLTLNDLEQQIPKARSRIANVGERLVDKASTELQKSKRVVNTPAVRLLTAGERVTKAAGRSQRLEAGRAAAPLTKHVDAIKAVAKGSPEDVANFWYAQVPKAHRNVETLKLVREQQAAELQRVTSGQALDDLGRQEQAVRAKMAAADGNVKLPFLKDLEEIKAERTHLGTGGSAQETAASIADLDRAIQAAPLPNEPAIAAVHAFGDVRQGILGDGGRLNLERAAARKGLVSRWLGIEPSGEEAYLGHRLTKPEGFRGASQPSGGTGRVASPKGLGMENKLVLARTGRLRQSLYVAAEDHQSAQVFHQANVARENLGKMGTQFTGHVPEGSVLVNPKGRTVPPHWKTDELAQFHEGYEDVEQIRNAAKEIVDGFVGADPAGWERIKNEALEQGVAWDELKVVPKRLLDRYYSQFRASKGRSTPTKVYDGMIDAVSTSIIFARVGYVPKNVAQNIIMAVPHQGAMLPVNAVRAAQAIADPDLRHFIQAEVGGTGATGSLGDQMLFKRILGGVTGAMSKVADDPIRFSAFMHEAAAAGVISKIRPLLGEKDRRALIDLFTDPAKRPLLNDIRSRAVDAMADFSRMTPDQAKMARRFLIIPGWLVAGSRYPFHFAATHPIRSALLAYIAMGEPGAPDGLQFNKPVDEYFTGEGYKRGIDTPAGRIRTSSLSPVSTPWELAQAAVGTARGKEGPFDFNTPTIWDSVQPLAGAVVGGLQGQGWGRAGKRLIPGEQFVEQMISPRESANYPEDRTRLGRLKREFGVVPIRVNDEAPSKGRKRGSSRGSSYAGGGSSGGSVYAGGGSSGGSSYAGR